MFSPMSSSSLNSTNPLIAKVHQLFSRDLALENDYLCWASPTCAGPWERFKSITTPIGRIKASAMSSR